jgi:hypothetical protein
MKTKLKTILSYLPEASFLVVALFWFIDNLLASHVNFFMVVIMALVAILLIWRIKALAVSLSVCLGIGSFYMLLAVVSEFQEFPIGDPNGLKLLVIGLLIFIALMAMSFTMPLKYIYRAS